MTPQHMTPQQAHSYIALSRVYKRFLDANAATFPHDRTVPHFESWVDFDRLGLPVPYRKTFEFAGEFINDQHGLFATCKTGAQGLETCIDIGIEGYLQRGDALKLYEMAYFCAGDILELGTHKGLSTSIVAQATQDAGRSSIIETVDVDGDANQVAKANLRGRPGERLVRFNLEDAGAFMRRAKAQGRRFGFIFVDHWHGYDATREAADLVIDLLIEGGFVLFHDYSDPANFDPAHVYGVYQAVADTLFAEPGFLFYGNSGCCGLFRKLPHAASVAGKLPLSN